MALTKIITVTFILALSIGVFSAQWLAGNQLRLDHRTPSCQPSPTNGKSWHLQVNNSHWTWLRCNEQGTQ